MPKKRIIGKSLRKNQAVSEVFGTILLLVISVSLFSVVYASLFSVQAGPATPTVNIVGTIDRNMLVLEHRGGDSLSLKTQVILEYNDGSREVITVDDEDYLNNTYKGNAKWDIGERVVYPLDGLINFARFDPVKIFVVDGVSSSVIMMGTVSEARVADIQITMSVTNNKPEIDEKINITLNATNFGPSDAKNVTIKYILPDSLKYQEHSTSQGTYDNETGLWDVGNIDNDSYAILELKVKVVSFPYNPRTQFAILLDGSVSIDPDSWQHAIQGIASAVESVIPRDNSVELTIIQFAGTCINPPDVGPIVVTQSNVGEIKTAILDDMSQDGGATPMGAGIYLATDELRNTNNFGGFHRSYKQAILVVTDGNPNVVTDFDDLCGYYSPEEGKSCASYARDYLLDNLDMTDDQDEFNVIAVDPGDYYPDIDQEWLCNQIVWPEPCYNESDGWPPPGSGWYRYVDSWEDFEDTIAENFKVMFRKVDNQAVVIETGYMDPNSNNNMAIVSIYPQGSS